MDSSRKLQIILASLTSFLLLTSTISLYALYTTHEELRQANVKLGESKKNADELQSRLISESIKRVGAQKDAENSEKNASRMKENSELLGALGLSLAGHMDNLDKLLVDIDNTCIETVNWFAENAKFSASSGALDVANNLYSGFKMDHERQTDAYGVVKAGIDKDITDFGSLVEFYATFRDYEDDNSDEAQVR